METFSLREGGGLTKKEKKKRLRFLNGASSEKLLQHKALLTFYVSLLISRLNLSVNAGGRRGGRVKPVIYNGC